MVVAALLTAGLAAGCNPLYGPCERQLDCAQGLRCVNLGGDYGAVCTRACTIQKSRSGLPDAIDDDAFFEDGTVQNTTVTDQDANCLEGGATVLVEGGNFDVAPENDGDIIGVCRVSEEQLANAELGGNSNLTGWCVPL